MSPAIPDTLAKEPTTGRDRAVDAVRHAEHLAHEARLLKTLASDAVEDGVHAAKRAITHGVHDLEDLRDSATHRIRRAPLMAVCLAFGAGLLLGAVCGQIGRSAAIRTR